MRKKSVGIVIGFCLLYYGVLYLSLLSPLFAPNQVVLRDRFGTTLWHTSDKGGVEHIYCYYPGEAHQYVLKKVENISECKDWYGVAILNEGTWATEKEKYL